MSFNGNQTDAKVYAPGYFLGHEECVRVTREIQQALATTAPNGTKYVPAGTPYPAVGDTAEGLLYEDIDVTTGNMPGSVVTQGIVIKDRIDPSLLTASTLTALGNKGFTFVDEASVTRPY